MRTTSWGRRPGGTSRFGRRAGATSSCSTPASSLKGDIFAPLRALLDTGGGVAGRWGVVTNDLRSFEEAESSGEVDAVEGYLMAFRRDILNEVGLLDEKYRFYRHLDLDLSFAARRRGYTAVIDTALPVTRHEHVDWAGDAA